MLTLFSTPARPFLKGQLGRLRSHEEGVTVVEYSIMLALVALAVALAAPNIRDAVLSIFNATATALGTL